MGQSELQNLWSRVLERPHVYRWSFFNVQCGGDSEVAWIAADGKVSISRETRSEELDYRITLVLLQSSSGWKIVHYHGSEPAKSWIES